MTDKQEPSFTQADLQHAVRDINEHFATKQKHVAKKDQIIDFIIATVGGSFGPDPENEGQTIWTDERGKSLSAQTIATYEALVDAGFGPKAEPEPTAEEQPQPETVVEEQTPEVAAAEAAGEPDPAAAPDPEPAAGEPQECPDFGKPLNKAKDEGYDPDSPDCQPDSCNRAAECAAAVEAGKAAKSGRKKKESGEPKQTKPGVIAAIQAIIMSGPHSKGEILAKLEKQFPDRDSKSMKSTINVQLPNRMSKEKGIKIEKNEAGKFYVAA